VSVRWDERVLSVLESSCEVDRDWRVSRSAGSMDHVRRRDSLLLLFCRAPSKGDG